MLVDVSIGEDRCNYEFCRHFENGKCRSADARKECLEIAIAVLCIDKDKEDEQ